MQHEPSPAELIRFAEIAHRYTPRGARVIWRRDTPRYKTWGTAYARGQLHPNKPVIAAIRPVTRKYLMVYLHECAHFILGHFKAGFCEVTAEYEAERWAIDTMRREGVKVPRAEILEAKRRVLWYALRAETVPYRVRRWLGL
jgi:hypothetical protein